jgi:hypothetical protein
MIIIVACSSPMDINTPKITIPLGDYRAIPNLNQVMITENGQTTYFNANNVFVRIDTISETPAIWLNMSFDNPSAGDSSRINVTKFSIYIDSLSVSGYTHHVIGVPDSSTLWSKFTIRRAIDAAYDTTLNSNNYNNISDVSVNINKDSKEMWLFLNAMLYSKRFWFEERDTIITDPATGFKISIPIYIGKQSNDSLHFYGSFSFQYK